MRGIKKISYNAPVILTFTFLALVSLILGFITKGTSTTMFFTAYRDHLTSPLFYLRLLTHVLGHADLAHFTSNFMVILLVGPMLEEKYTSQRLAFMIIVTAFITGVINVLFFKTGLLGASGIAFMLIVLSSFTNTRDNKIPLTFILVGILYLGNELLTSFTSLDNISQLTHIVGGICGGIFGFILNKR